jgi:3-oxoacyl-[acyl-carrier protein] reductase
MNLHLTGKTALVCGASAGIGRAIAEELAAEGADVVLSARREGPLKEAADAIARDHGVRTLAVSADVSKRDDIARLVETVEAQFERVDILISNSGGPPSGRFGDLTPDHWRAAADLLLFSAVELARAVLPGMQRNGWGRIIHVASTSVKEPVDGLMLSNSLRSAVIGFAKTLASEVGAHGVTVNNILPGYTDTERLGALADAVAKREGCTPEEAYQRWRTGTPIGRLVEPREIGALAAFLASERAGAITGASIAVDGGRTRSML